MNDTGDGATIPPGFRFLEESVLGPGVEPAEEGFRGGCECADAEDCMYNGCDCLAEMEDSDDSDVEKQDFANKLNGRPKKKRFAYHSRGAKTGILRSKILTSREPIYECHDGCACDKETCPNRVVSRGRTVPLQIFRTENRGWGVRSHHSIQKGQFVDRYLGEVITSDEADRRRADSDLAQRKDVYLFALDKFSDENSHDPRLAGPPFEVDGEFMAGPTRFINHSCDPNMRIFARVGDHADKHIHDLAFFAVREIKRFEELTFDYVDGLEDMDTDAADKSKQSDMTKCLCGTEKCRGYLW